MRIGFGQQARALRRGVLAPNLGKAQEEALLRRETIFLRGSFRVISHLLPQGHERDAQAAVVSRVLAQGKASVEMNVIHSHKGAVLIGDAARALLELLAVFRCPPVGEITLSVEFAALIVKAVRELVADHDADAAEVHCIIFAPVEEWWLQNAGREV